MRSTLTTLKMTIQRLEGLLDTGPPPLTNSMVIMKIAFINNWVKPAIQNKGLTPTSQPSTTSGSHPITMTMRALTLTTVLKPVQLN